MRKGRVEEIKAAGVKELGMGVGARQCCKRRQRRCDGRVEELERAVQLGFHPHARPHERGLLRL